MKDNKGIERKVIHSSNKPQDFEKSDQVVVIGKIQADTFISSSLLLKCPSKYNDNQKPKDFGQQEFKSK